MTNDQPTERLDRAEIKRAFNRAATQYDDFAFLQREVGARLFQRLDFMQLAATQIVDLGAGTGFFAEQLEKRFRQARVLLVDYAHGMLAHARSKHTRWFSRAHYVCADAQRLCLADQSVDLIFSNLTLQWCEDLPAVFRECRRILRPEGLLLFTTLGPATLHELRAAWAQVDSRPHVNLFLDMHEVGDALIHGGFASPVLDREDLILTYSDIVPLMRDLKGIGAHNSNEARARGLAGRRTLTALTTAYEAFRRDQLLPATYEIVYGHAWAPTPRSRPQDGSTVATFPFKQLTRRRS